MNSNYCTPQKNFSTPSLRLLNEKSSQQMGTGPCSDQKRSGGSGFQTPNGPMRRGGRFYMLPVMNNKTPNSGRLTKIVNPFEASLTERLHLPLICSPSLFHRPATPQLSSTQFEWTIDEVASLGPVHVEPHETQFQIHTDPEMEAKAQAAITSYFREKHIVPSPANCSVRNVKLILDDDLDSDCDTTTKKKVKTNDGVAQTILTFPPELPKEVEDLLKPFFSYNDDQQQTHEDSSSHQNDSSNASLRRKLFETSLNSDDMVLSKHESDFEHILLEAVNPIGTPDLKLQIKVRTRHFGSPSDNVLNISSNSLKKESFGSLSPILNSGSLSSKSSAGKENKNHSSTSSLYRSTPERMGQRSMSSNSVEMSSIHGSAIKARTCPEFRTKITDATNDSLDEMQLSNWSDMNVTSSQRLMDLQTTPIRRENINKSASRKNLSRSFTHIFNEEFGSEFTEDANLLPLENENGGGLLSVNPPKRENLTSNKRLLRRTTSTTSDSIGRTDSGFNDDDLSSNNRKSSMGTISSNIAEDVSMSSILL